MKLTYLRTISFLFIVFNGYFAICQNVKRSSTAVLKSKNTEAPGYAKTKWTLNDPFEQKVFIENNGGQFDGRTSSGNDKILFCTRINEIYLYFSATGIIYRYDKYPPMKHDGKKSEDSEEENIKPETHFFSISWKGANQKTDVLAEDEQSFYYTYSKSDTHTTIAHAFRKLLYKNIYPAIDIEYSFPEDKKGLEYAIIVHPGADLSQVKMLYNDAGKIKLNSGGDIESESSFGQFVDHSPVKTFYQDGSGSASCSFSLSGNEVSYISNYDKTKTLVIDPWMVSPGFANYNAGYDICYDVRGNVYSYGSFAPYQEIKINSAGVIQWIYTLPNVDPQYADFAVDEGTGISYDGSCTNPTIYKVDTAGLLTKSYVIGNNMEELWRMAFNKCENHLVLDGGGVGLINQACTLDTGLTTLNVVNVLSATDGHNDMTFLTIDNDNSSVFMAVAANLYGNKYPNKVLRCPLPSLSPTSYLVSDGLNFEEGVTGPTYVDGVFGHGFGMNGAITSPNWLYLYDGGTLNRYNKNTGATILSKTISPTHYAWGGLDADLCDNMYMGKADTIVVYDSSLNNIGKILAPNTVYDLHIAPNNILVACGLHFVSSFVITTNPITINFTTVRASCSSTTGKATARLTGCGNDSSTYNYRWSDGTTNQTDTGLAPGSTYTVYVSTACDFVYVDSVKIPSLSNDGLSVTATYTNVLCNGLKDGSATAIVTGGISPFTYTWAVLGNTTQSVSNLSVGTYTVQVTDSSGSCALAYVTISQPTKLSTSPNQTNISCNSINNGIATTLVSGGTGAYTYLWTPTVSTSDSALNLSMGTYTVTVNDSNGCSQTDVFTITQPTALGSNMTQLNVGCYGLSTGKGTASVSGGTGPYTYSWAPSGGTNSSASNLSAGTYTITVKDSHGCIIIDSVTITQPAKIVASISGNDSICAGTGETLTVSGGGTYLWNTSQTTSSISITETTTQTYSCTITVGACSVDTSITVIAKLNPPLGLTISGDSICEGDSVTLIASGGGTYKWSTSATSSSITVNPTLNTTYSLVVSNGTCSRDTTVTIKVSTMLATISKPDSICVGDSVKLNSSGGGTYLWSTGSTQSSITVNPFSTQTYSVTIKNGKCAKDTSVRVKVNPLPNPKITGSSTICKGDTATLTVSGGGTYLWSPSLQTNAVIKVSPATATTYTAVVTNSFGCTRDTTFKLTPVPPSGSIKGAVSICPGDSITLDASGGGTYKWSTGATSSSITVKPTASSTYYVVVSKICVDTVTKNISIDIPSLYACCDTTTYNPGTPVTLNASGTYTYIWNPSSGLSCTTCPDPTVTPSVTTTYTVIGTDSAGCSVERIITVDVSTCGGLKIPNVFTPNGDNRNDEFVIDAQNVSDYSIYIYDRWGKEMFKNTNPDVYWNGINQNDNSPVSVGVYYYILKYTCNGKSYTKDGYLQLIR
jgi:gliding motility-associated-like protein